MLRVLRERKTGDGEPGPGGEHEQEAGAEPLLRRHLVPDEADAAQPLREPGADHVTTILTGGRPPPVRDRSGS